MQRIEYMVDERQQRIEKLIRDVEGVTAALDESTSRSIKDLIGKLREGLVLSSVANLAHLCGEDMGSNPAWTVSGH